jgi:hypothetical protein
VSISRQMNYVAHNALADVRSLKLSEDKLDVQFEKCNIKSVCFTFKHAVKSCKYSRQLKCKFTIFSTSCLAECNVRRES